MVKFEKRATTPEEQVGILLKRGMAGDEAKILRSLTTTSYYRLSAYWFTFRREEGKIRFDDFLPGTSFDVVWDRYCFDRKLRILVMEGIERIEIALRAALAHWHAQEHGPFAYMEVPTSLPKFTSFEREQFILRVREETDRSKKHEDFSKHFYDKYGDSHKNLPIWSATEIMTFRTVLTMFKACSHSVKKKVADVFGMPDSVFSSWLLTLNAVRNVCAHHGRLWNRQVVSPVIPTGKAYRQWNAPVLIKHERMFASLTIVNYCVGRVEQSNEWASRFKSLLREHRNVPVKYMGFPPNWADSPLWGS